MALFQEAIIRKYLRNLDEEVIETAFKEYKRVYSPEKIKNIRVAKEEQYQEGFIKEIFGSVLGYSVYPESPYNIETEKKNETNSKKADGAILKDEKVVGVIELKDNKTKNLDAVKDQAFGYKNNHKECSYVISSNFHKLRFYIDDATDYEEFDLYNLDKETFKRFYLYLRKEGLLDKNIPKLLRQETKFHEEEISKKLYKDYSNFKRSFFENALKNNPEFDKLTLFKKSQKFLDRVLFILFAEDKGLVTTNSVVQIVEKWQSLKDDAFDTPRPLYNLILLFFNNLYQGKKDNNGMVLIPEFGGELFAPDEVLDQLSIDDEVLKDDLLKLSKYDFNTDVDVNILGHIFEHSLNEVDDVEAELRGEQLDKTKSKRKKDGVFYTPKYITKYIVDNTLGKLCSEKKIELNLDDDIAIYEYFKSDGKLNEKGKNLYERLNSYKNWLLTVTVCDPACGSGAFLNQALSYFIEEHKFVDDLIAELTNTPLRLFDTELQILENNIFGVDINEESVEIAKLSLWLRTAQPGRKLSNLSNNIKCGNSLIEDSEVSGDKAFNWEKEFPSVFEEGGFDVVIGNPPYVKLETIKETSEALEKVGYSTFDKRGDLYVLFVELGFNIAKPKGHVSYIMPNKWLQAGYGEKLRRYFLTKQLSQLIDFGDIQIFEGATTYPVIFTAVNTEPSKTFDAALLKKELMFDFHNNVKINSNTFETAKFNGGTWIISSGLNNSLLERLSKQFKTLKEFVNGEANYGIKPGLSEAFIISKEKREQLISTNPASSEITGPFLRGRDIKRYSYPNEYELDFLILAHFGSHNFLEAKYPSIYDHLTQYKDQLSKRGQCQGSLPTEEKPFNGQHHWLELDNNPTLDYLNLYSKPKIMYQVFQVTPCFIYDETGLYCNNSMWILPTENKALLGILNSKMGWWLTTKYCTQIQNGCQLIWKYFGQIPIPPTTSELTSLVETMLELQKNFQSQTQKLSTYISSQYQLEKLSGKLSSWYDLNFSEFIKELSKAIKTSGGTPLTKKDEFEWMELFEENKKQTLDLKSQIDQTDKEIDRMVYELYGLTNDEIQIVENS